MKISNKIAWSYWHSLSSKSRSIRTKTGIYLGKVKHTRKYWSKVGAEQMCIVKFYGNKKVSRVPYDEITFE